MATIDIGSDDFNDTGLTGRGNTYVDLHNPANETGILTMVHIRLGVAIGAGTLKVGTFYGSGDSYTCRAYQTWENVGWLEYYELPANIQVHAGDFLGTYRSSGAVCYDYNGVGQWYLSGDEFSEGNTFQCSTYVANRRFSVGATGISSGGAGRLIGGNSKLIGGPSPLIGGPSPLIG